MNCSICSKLTGHSQEELQDYKPDAQVLCQKCTTNLIMVYATMAAQAVFRLDVDREPTEKELVQLVGVIQKLAWNQVREIFENEV